jgi:protocatechuate 3,4-dioxygenase beta subunit
MQPTEFVPSRRRLLFAAAAALPAAALMQACAAGPARDRNPGEPAPTPEQTEGPFYRLFSAPKANLREPGLVGTSLDLTGRVVDRRGRPLANALLDFWQCDGSGVYDVRGFRLRGHQYTDAEGRYRLETILPGLYPGRTRHIHVKVQPAGADVPKDPGMLSLTTQIYFPGEERNRTDEIFDPELLVAMDAAGTAKVARFDFVFDLG